MHLRSIHKGDFLYQKDAARMISLVAMCLLMKTCALRAN